ncbi:signal peptide peptidase SppA [Fusobacterium sp.]|uniref:signal peptide peptidase SppA n=1 Tax=Fusobacterium sp. TaxID=68766 RepID=UPI002610DE14|nr:signal peptide peptidase SppA [Fusobacterium sp.]
MGKFKKVLLFVVAECFKALFRLLMFALVVYIAGKIIALETKKKPIDSKTYIELTLSDEISESRVITPFDLKKEMNFYGLLKNLEKAERDERVEGLILRLDNIGLSRGQIEEFSNKILEFKKNGKKVYAYAPSFTNQNYVIASLADKIIMPKTMGAMSEIKGYFMEIPYYKALGDKIGVKMNVIHIGDYKSAGESYERTDMSKEHRENMTRMLDTVYNNFVETVAKNRKLDKKLLNERILDGRLVLADPETMVRNGLVDELEYYESFLAKNEIVNKVGIDEYLSRKNIDYKTKEKKDNKVKDKIAIIYAEGTINYSDDTRKINEVIIPERIQKELRIAEKDPEIKGVVIRINSPGGSALASDIIYSSVKNMTKPVYISMGGVAASGGYYIAAAGKKIYADKETLTGSIGVITMVPNTTELMKKLEVNYSSISKGKYADLGSTVREMTEDEKDKIRASSVKVYEEFVSKVAEGRNMSREDVLKVAEGRVWLGEEAKKIGLVDEIGGLENAVSDLAKELKLEDYETLESLKEEKIESVIKNYLPKYLMAQMIGDNKITETIKKNNMISEELLYKPVLYAPNIDIK